MNCHPDIGFVSQPPTAPQPPKARQFSTAPPKSYVPRLYTASRVSYVTDPSAAPQVSIDLHPDLLDVNMTSGGYRIKRKIAMTIHLLKTFGLFIFLVLIVLVDFGELTLEKYPNISREEANLAGGISKAILIVVMIFAILTEIFGFFAAKNESFCMIVTYIVLGIIVGILFFYILRLSWFLIADIIWIIFCIWFCVDMRRQINNGYTL